MTTLFTADLSSTDGDSDNLAAELACARERIEQLERAVESHELVGRASGILMAVHRIDADRAFAAMTRVSSQSNVRLRDVAEALIALMTSEDVVADSPAVTAAIQLLPVSSHQDA